MDAAFALLLPLVGGYLFIKGSTFLKYKVAREDGHRLYFRVAYHGVCLFLASLAILGLLYLPVHEMAWFGAVESFLAAALQPLLKSPEQASGMLGFLVVCLFSVFLGRASPLLVNKIFRRTTEDALWEAAAENELEEFLLEALLQAKSVAITMTNHKVYVGLVLSTPEPRTERRMIALLPLMSGYREAEGKVNFTTFYDQIYAGREDSDNGDFKLVLPIDKMMSLAFFDVTVYAAFSEVEPPENLRATRHSATP